MHETFRLGRVAGIPIGINWSMLAVFWLVTWSLAGEALPAAAPGYDDRVYWAVGAGAAVLFYAGLLAHELAHSLVSRRHGIGVRSITLWLFGGVAQLEGEAMSPKVEFRIAIAGPLTSFGAAGAFVAVALVLHAANGPDLVVSALAWLGAMNALLAVFNLIPAAPLDGGRVLRAALWRRHGDPLRAGVSAARAGRAFGYVLIAFGLLEFVFGGAAGLWSVFLGWFLLGAAGAEERHHLLRGALGEARVSEIMSPRPVTAPEWSTVAEVVDRYLWPHHISSLPICGADGSVTGLVTLDHVRRVPRDDWAVRTAAEVATPLADVAVSRPDDLLVEVLERMAGRRDGRALVFDRDTWGQPVLVGIVSPSDVNRAVQTAALRSTDPVGRGEDGGR